MEIGLVIALILLSILIVILITLFTDEKRLKSTKAPDGRLTGVWEGSERRTSIRIEAKLKAKYAIDNTPQEKRETMSKNISLGGILMELYEKLYPSTLLLLDIFLPDHENPVMAKGEVVWVKELQDPDEAGRRMFDAGIRFLSMAPHDKERLDQQLRILINRHHG